MPEYGVQVFRWLILGCMKDEVGKVLAGKYNIDILVPVAILNYVHVFFWEKNFHKNNFKG